MFRGSDHELLVAKFRLKLKKVGKTTRPSRYDLNQIPYDYTVEVRNRFKGLDLIDRVPDELCSGGLRWDPRHKGPFCPSLWLACSTETDISYNNPTQPLTGHPGGPPSQPSEQLSSSNQLSLTLPLVGTALKFSQHLGLGH